MVPTATVEHAMSGRLRVKVSERRGDFPYFRTAIEKLSNYPEIAALQANPATGSILIQHKADLPSIRKIAVESGVFDMQEKAPSTKPLPLAKTYVSSRVTRGAGPAEVGLIGLGAYQAVRGQAVGPATENLWNAFGALRILNSPSIALVFAGLGVLQLTRGRWAGSASSLLFYALVIRRLSSLGLSVRSHPSPSANHAANSPDGI